MLRAILLVVLLLVGSAYAPAASAQEEVTITQAHIDLLKAAFPTFADQLQAWFDALDDEEEDPDPDPDPDPAESNVIGLPAQKMVDGVLRPSILNYPEPRSFEESQAWWTPQGETHEGWHVHFGMAKPIGPVKGTIELEFRALLHNVPLTSTGYLLRIMQKSDEYVYRDNGAESISLKPKPHNTGDERGDAELWRRFSYDTTELHDGYNELRCTMKVRHANGQQQFNSSGWGLYVANTSSTSDDRNDRPSPWEEARGWYEGSDYHNARFRTPLPYAPLTGSHWSVYSELVPGSGGGAVDYHFARIDPNFHAGNPGIFVRTQGSDSNYATLNIFGVSNMKVGKFAWKGNLGEVRNVSGTLVKEIPLGGLSPGTHRLVLGSSSLTTGQSDPGRNGRNTGVMVVPFVVE